MEINMDFYAAALRAEEPENGFTWDAEGSAAKDPEWREKIATAYEDCHELAESWPATSLNRRPMTRMFGLSDPVDGDHVEVLSPGIVSAVHHGAHWTGQGHPELGTR